MCPVGWWRCDVPYGMVDGVMCPVEWWRCDVSCGMVEV